MFHKEDFLLLGGSKSRNRLNSCLRFDRHRIETTDLQKKGDGLSGEVIYAFKSKSISFNGPQGTKHETFLLQQAYSPYAESQTKVFKNSNESGWASTKKK
jgi:hypothetical protein